MTTEVPKPQVGWTNHMSMGSLEDAKANWPKAEHEDLRAYVEHSAYLAEKEARERAEARAEEVGTHWRDKAAANGSRALEFQLERDSWKRQVDMVGLAYQDEIEKLKAELKLAQETNHYDCIGAIAKLKAQCQVLVNALKRRS